MTRRGGGGVVKQFPVSFDTDGGTPTTIPPVVVDSGTALGALLPAAPVKAGFTFAGWYEGTVPYTAATPITGAVALKAAWTPVAAPAGRQFAVAFHTNGGIPATVTPVIVDSGALVGTIIPAAAVNPTKTGYTFVGWFDLDDSKEYTAVSTVAKDMMLIALWRDNVSNVVDTTKPKRQYVVAFDPSGGTPAAYTPVVVDSGAGLAANFPSPNPIKADSVFAGWFDGTVAYTAATPVLKNMTLLARWTTGVVPPLPATFTVRFDTTGGTPAIAPVAVDSGTALGTLFPADPEKAGYTFGGWYDSTGAILTAPYTAATVITKNVTLTAAWTALTVVFTVRFDTDGGTPDTIAAVTADSGTALGTKFPAAPVKAGYTFGGWADSAAVYTATTPITKHVTLKAVWTAGPYTLTVVLNPASGGGSVTRNPTGTNATLHPAGTTVTLTASPATNHVFAGWSGASTSTEPVIALSMDSSITVTATFLPTYTLTVNVVPTATTGKVTRDPEMARYPSGTEVTLTAVPEDGFDFKGWTGAGITAAEAADSVVKVTVSSNLTATATFAVSIAALEIEMVLVQGGTFTMGCTEEQGNDCYTNTNNYYDYYSELPVSSVTLSDFYIGKYPVTQKQWKLVMDGANPSAFTGDDLPVDNITWNDVQQFLARLQLLTGKEYRFPTEAEWEYAARGGANSGGFKYSGSDDIFEVGRISDNSTLRTWPVGSLKANELGIYDMSGNVFEWVSDFLGTYTADPKTNPRGATSGSYRVLRGGGWNSPARYARVSCRIYASPTTRSDRRGFRLAITEDPAAK